MLAPHVYSKVRELNDLLFSGKPVLSMSGRGTKVRFVFNISLITPAQYFAHNAVQAPVPTQAAFVGTELVTPPFAMAHLSTM